MKYLKRTFLLLLLTCIGVGINAQSVQLLEYWFDDDITAKQHYTPGSSGKVTNITSAIIQTANITEGMHALHIRAKDSKGEWSVAHSQNFYKYKGSGYGLRITGVEYWLNDLYSERKFQDTESDASSVILRTIDLEGYTPGFYMFNLRAQDSRGFWSIAHSFPVFKTETAGGKFAITSIEYWLNDDYSNKQIQAVNASEPIAMLTGIDMKNIATGFHLLNYRAKDSRGLWSVVHSQPVYKCPGSEGILRITEIEYWLNDSINNKKSQTIESTGSIALLEHIDLSGVESGLYTLNFRIKDSRGLWSVVHSQSFYANTAFAGGSNKIDAYRYWYDADFDLHELVVLDTPVNPYELETNWVLPIDFKESETHTFHIQFRDLAGKWSDVATNKFKITPPVAVESISLNKTSTTILTGGSETLSYIINPGNASNRNVRWSTNNEQVAVVDDGVVHAISNGTAIITVTSEDGNKTANCIVTVETLVVPVASINMNKSATSLFIGNSEMLTYSVSPENATNQNATWSSSNENVATVENGVITTIAVGTAIITVTTEDGAKTSQCTVTVNPYNVTGISLSKTSANIPVGGNETLAYTISPENATNRNATWSSSNESVATVENGVINAISIGTAVITVTSEDGSKTAHCNITVLPVEVESISLNKTTASLIIGEEETLTYTVYPRTATNQNAVWSSSNESVATVENGVVNAISVGEAVITITSENGNKTASCTITVLPIQVESINLNKTTVSLIAGENETLTYTINPGNATNQHVIWSSDNASVAMVENGVVSAISAGSAIITVTSEDGNKTANCLVNVEPLIIPVISIRLNKPEMSLFTGESEILTYTIDPSDATNQNVIWHSSDESVATVHNGLVTALTPGTATITVTAEGDNIFDQSVVTVHKIVQYNVEYFFDADPGFGKATGIADDNVQLVSETANETIESVSFNTPIKNLNDGLHTLYVRAKNSKGWSQTQIRTFMKASLAAESGLNIEHVEYFIDTDPGYGKGISTGLGENNGVYAFNVDMHPLADGFHTLYARARNVEGNWSSVMNRTFVKMILPSDLAAGIKAVEYYLDTDPGTGKGGNVPFHADRTDINFTVDLNNVAYGEHTLYLRILNHLDQWEAAGSHTFTLIGVPDGIDETDAANELAIYPNPVSEFLFIKNENHIIKSVEIIDTKGHTVFMQHIQESNIITIPVYDYVKGVFIVKIHTHSGNVRELKMIKK